MEVSLVIIAGDSRSAESELSETNRTRHPDQLFYALTILSVTCHVRLPHISESYIQNSPHRSPRRGGRVGEGRCVMRALAVLTTKVRVCKAGLRRFRSRFERGSTLGRCRARLAALGSAEAAATAPEGVVHSFFRAEAPPGTNQPKWPTESNELR